MMCGHMTNLITSNLRVRTIQSPTSLRFSEYYPQGSTRFNLDKNSADASESRLQRVSPLLRAFNAPLGSFSSKPSWLRQRTRLPG